MQYILEIGIYKEKEQLNPNCVMENKKNVENYIKKFKIFFYNQNI